MKLYVFENTGEDVYFQCLTEEQINEKLTDGSWGGYTIWKDSDIGPDSSCCSEVYWSDNIPEKSVVIIQGRVCDTVTDGGVLKLLTPMVPLAKEKVDVLKSFDSKEIFKINPPY